MNKAALDIQNLSAGFGNSHKLAVQDISFHVNHGECLAVVGESGSGKSVTSLHAMGLLQMPPAFIRDGKIEVDGQAVLNLDPESRRKLRGKSMAMVFQEPMSSLNPVLKCGFQVQEMLIEHEDISKKEAKGKVLELFAKVKLPDAERAYTSYPHELSGGQKQRVVIAMAIACNPTLLIADEPTTALDVTVQKEIILLLKDLQTHHNMALLFITHDLGVVAEIADRVVVMRKGKVIEYGDVKTILSNPKDPYTKGLIACRPPWSSRPHRLPTVQQFLGEVPPVDATLTAAD
ncbi:MAG: peptide/nickel transport system ATP-binding protein, partial [Flavobacteriales bacterium]